MSKLTTFWHSQNLAGLKKSLLFVDLNIRQISVFDDNYLGLLMSTISAKNAYCFQIDPSKSLINRQVVQLSDVGATK